MEYRERGEALSQGATTVCDDGCGAIGSTPIRAGMAQEAGVPEKLDA
jgi:hypothetical protein